MCKHKELQTTTKYCYDLEERLLNACNKVKEYLKTNAKKRIYKTKIRFVVR